MGGTAPTLFWFDRADERIGILHPAGAVEHREELGGEDALSFSCLETPEKYDRILWRDPSDGRWREHVVVRTDEALGAACEVYAESSLCDLLGSYVEEERVSGSGLYGALGVVLEGDALAGIHAWLVWRSRLLHLPREPARGSRARVRGVGVRD